ncbi:Protein transport protein sec20 [Glycine max]|nr:Protein transport protein sec20 [Glycine max]KAH1208843.1 Protein transport protein sec20 [Glycine max]
MDKVVEEAEKVKKEWDETYKKTQEHIEAIAEYGKPGRAKEEKNSLARLNGIAQDGLALLSSFLFTLDLLAPQLPSEPEVQSTRALLQSWKTLTQKENYFWVAEKSPQTKAGMTSAAESITESLRRTRQLMVQEVERNTSTLMTLDESTGVLKKAESEYKGHRSLLMRTRNLLSTMQRQDVIDRVIIGVGFLLFSLAVLYVVYKRIGLLTLQRKVTEAIKAGMVGQAELRPQAVADDLNLHQVRGDCVHNAEAPLEQRIHDEL